MASHPTTVLRQVIRTAARGDLPNVTDRDLIRRFVADNDQAAFAVLAGRHSGMVLGVCRWLLPTVQDAEDACQGTFLLLAQKANSIRWQVSVANWLHITARRVARNARVVAQRRARREARAAQPEVVGPVDRMTGRELLAALDDELERLPPRYREPLVLCYLEGLTRDEAATRLGVPLATLHTRLDRGRKRLHEALTKSGCALGAGLLALAVTSSAGASPSRLIKAILAVASGSVPDAVAELIKGVAVDGIGKKMTALVLALVGAAVLGLGLGIGSMPPLAAEDKQPAQEKPTKPAPMPAPDDAKEITVFGRVLGPDGKPVPDVVLTLLGELTNQKQKPTELARTNADGQYRIVVPNPEPGHPDFRVLVARAAGFGADWIDFKNVSPGEELTLRLPADDVPLRGRVLDLEGRPIAGAKVRIATVETTPDGNLEPVFTRWPQDPYAAVMITASKRLYVPTAAGLPETVAADRDGRFEIKGVGRGRLLGIRFEGDGIESAAARIVTLPDFDPKKRVLTPRAMAPGLVPRPGPEVYGPDFTHTARPDQPITGVVRDHKTGKPLAGIDVHAGIHGGWFENRVRTKTDAEGKYVLRGVGKGAERQVYFSASEDTPYLKAGKVVADVQGLAPINVDAVLVRGVVLTGRVTDQVTGRPVLGAWLSYTPLSGNKILEGLPGADAYGLSASGAKDDDAGRYRLVIPPGVGLIMAQVETRGGVRSAYTQVRLDPADKPRAYLEQVDQLGEAFAGLRGEIVLLGNQSAYKVVDPADGTEALTLDLQFDPGRTASGQVVDPDGKPAHGVTAYGLLATFDSPTVLKDGRFTAVGLDPKHPRAVLFVHGERKLTGHVRLGGDEKEPPTVRLQPWGSVTGQVVDAKGKPVENLTVALSPPKPSRIFSPFTTAGRERVMAMTDADGRFRLDVRFPGEAFDVVVERKGQSLKTGASARDLKVAAGETKILDPITLVMED